MSTASLMKLSPGPASAGQAALPVAPVRPSCHMFRRAGAVAAPRCIYPASRSRLVCAARGGGSGVLDNPTTLPGNAPKKQSKSKRPPTYQVMLHNDSHNRREYVVRTLLKVVKGITADDAATAMQVAHETGVAMVTQCPQEEAEHYCQGLRINGLTSSIQPGC